MAESGSQITLSGGSVRKYPAKLHAQNAVRHLGVSEGLVFLPGQHRLYIEDSDMFYPFRQRRYFYYLSGVNEEDCYLTYDIGQDYSTLYIPPITVEGVSAIMSNTTDQTELKIRSTKVIWFGRGPTIKEAEERYDFDEVMLTSSMPDEIEDWLRVNPDKKVYVLRENQSLGHIIHSSPEPNYDMTSLMPAIDASRVIKDHDELVAIKRAIRISSIGHRTIMHHITSLKTEAEVHALYLDVCIAHGSQVQSYPPIIASGTNASSLHYFDANDTLEGKSLLCMDAGTEWECYSSDITRTFPLTAKGWPSKETAEIYALVEEMQERCIAMLGPGVRYLDAFVLADRIAIEGLMRMGIFRKADVEEVLSSGATKAFFPHGLGHHMGLDVHDVSAKPILSMTRRDNSSTRERLLENMADMRLEIAPCTSEAALLEPGMVITVEPGIYFNRYALNNLYLSNPQISKYIDREKLQIYMHVGGVRIEDDILITKDGYENLTMTPKGKEMLEIIRDGAKCKHSEKCRSGLDSQ